VTAGCTVRAASLIRAVVLCAVLAAAPARAEDFYVATDGADDNPGTMAEPFATVERGEMAAAPGDTVYIRGGVYAFSGTQDTVGVAFTKDGSSGQPIRYFAYPGETPIFDLFELRPQARVTGLDVQCNFIHLRGLEVRGVRQIVVGDSWSVRIRGDNNVIEQLHVHDGEAPGIFITSGAGNLILNCDSHHNYDPLEGGGNADGFGCHSTGGDNVMRGCRAWENSDDGYDFINAPGTCIVEESWAFRNGYIPDTAMTGANGAGFKAGGFGNPPNTPAGGAPRHVVRKCLAFRNRSIGFYSNYHPGGIDFLNNTAFDNPANFDMRPGTGSSSSHTLRNNVAAEPGRDIVSFTGGGTDDFNSWSLPVEVTSADFTSTDVAQALQPRQADGSLPRVAFLRLAEGSDLIDRGEDVGLPFTGSAPDLGAHEWGEEPPGDPPDGGMPDASAGAGAAGAAGQTGGSGGAQAGSSGMPRAGGGGAAGSAPPAGGTSAAMPPATGNAGGGSTAGTAGGEGEQDAGCGCKVARSRPAPPVWLLLLAAWLVLRAIAAARSPSRCA
jgi:hypothetical protein